MTSTQMPIQAAPGKLFLDNQAVYRALSDSQFVPYFQPLITLRTGQLAGFEVLARWKHPVEGMIPPDKFIPLAERDGWIGELTRQILKKALRTAASIPGTFTVSFNLSAHQLRDATTPDQIREIAAEADFPFFRLIAEITESALIENMEQAAFVVAELKNMGCKLALDDFGTGYSSLQHLQSLPFDELKVDRSFVSSMTSKRESRKIVSAVVGLGQSLGLTTVAEGIETQEQADMMVWLGCELGQGYFFGRPMPPEDLAASVASKRPVLQHDSSQLNKGTTRTNLEFSPSQRLAQLQALYDGAPVGLGFIDQNLRFVNLNNKLAEMNGGSLESFIGAHVSDKVPDMFPYLKPYLMRALAGEAISGIEVVNPTTGETRLINYQPAIDEAGEVVGIAVSSSDTTNRKLSESALRASSNHPESTPALETSPSHAGPVKSADAAGYLDSEEDFAIASIDETPLKSYEILALKHIGQSSDAGGIAIVDLARQMHTAGLVQATSLAVNSLRRRGFIVRRPVPASAGRSGTHVAGLLLTPSGRLWLKRHPIRAVETVPTLVPSAGSSGLIDLLTTLRFRA